MIEALATVVAVSDRRITIEYQRRSACGQCDHGSSCSMADSSSSEQKVQQFQIESTQAVMVGQMVRIGIPEKNLLNTVLLVYGLPLLLLMIGALLGQGFSTPEHADIYAILGAFLGGVFGFIGVRYAGKRFKSTSFQPVILGVAIPVNQSN